MASEGSLTKEGIWVMSASGADVVRSKDIVVRVFEAKEEVRARICTVFPETSSCLNRTVELGLSALWLME